MPFNEDLPRFNYELMRNASFEINHSREERLKKSMDSNVRRVHRLEGE